jgi:nicotinamidase-related amidase
VEDTVGYLKLERSRAALLLMDFQEGILAGQSETARASLLDRTRTALEAARSAGLLVIYVSVRLRQGYADVSPRNKRSAAARAAGRLEDGTTAVQITPLLAPLEGEPLVIKRRVGAFFGSDLEVVLRSHDIATLVLAGISTSGVVLTTVRTAADMDYDLVVLSDCCADPNPDLHGVLMDSVFPSQATIACADDFVRACTSELDARQC